MHHLKLADVLISVYILKMYTETWTVFVKPVSLLGYRFGQVMQLVYENVKAVSFFWQMLFTRSLGMILFWMSCE